MMKIYVILDRLEKIDHKEYSGGYEFADCSSFDEVGRCFDERKEFSKEIERLNNKLELISTIVEREFPPNEFITYKMKKILRGSDKIDK